MPAPTPPAPAPTSYSCNGLALCDDFESAAAGAMPDATKWAVGAPSCTGAGHLAIDGSVAHTGSHSVRVDGGIGYCDHIFFGSTAIAGLGPVVYGRFFVRLASAAGSNHVTLMAMHDTNDDANGNHEDLRMGMQNPGGRGVLMWNRMLDDATLPVLSPAGVSMSVALPVQQWSCVEFMVDQSAARLQTWVDGSALPGLAIDGVPTPDVDQAWLAQTPKWAPRLADFRLGWESYGNQAMTLWFDDVALSSQRIGCAAR